jgi:hypothetical protein
LRGYQTRFDWNQSIAESSRVSIQKIREVARRKAAIARKGEQCGQSRWVAEHLRDNPANPNLSLRITDSLKIIGYIEIQGVADGPNGYRRHPMSSRFRKYYVAFHFDGFRLLAELEFFCRARYQRPRCREPLHLPRAALHCRRQQLRMACDRDRFANFTNEAGGQNVTWTVLASKSACQTRRNANVGPVGKHSARRLQGMRLPHARQDRANTRPAELRFKARPIARQSPELPPVPPWREFGFDRECDQNLHRS